MKRSLSWLAGYLEGEGTFQSPPPSAPNWYRIQVNATDHDVIAYVAGQFGTKVRRRPARQENWNDTFQATSYGQKAVSWMEQLYPFMGERRRGQIEKAIGNVPAEHDKKLNIVEWIAGLLEGEGSFMKGPPSEPNVIRIQMQMRDEDVIHKVCGYFGVAAQGPYQPTNPNASPYYTFVKRGKKAADFMTLIRPIMGERRQQQINDALASHYHQPQIGETHSQAKLTEADVRFIKQQLRDKACTQISLACKYGVDPKVITFIKQGKTWSHVTLDD